MSDGDGETGFDSRVRREAFIVMTVLVPVFLGAYMFAGPILTRSGT
jgi:hypothetical protein